MTEDVKQARRTGRAALVAHVRSLLTQRRLAVGGVIGLIVGIAVSSVLLSVLGEPASEDAQAGLGAVDVAATVLVGFGAGVLTLSICTLFWRAHDLPRQSKPPIKDVLLSERHLASISEAQARGIPRDEAHAHAERSLRAGERESIIAALDDQVARQSVGALVLTLPCAGLIPAMIGVFVLDGSSWGSLVWVLLSVQVSIFNVRLWDNLGRAVEVRGRLARVPRN
jgi:hypothetical protein